MKCYLTHFTVLTIEGRSVWSSHWRKNLYAIILRHEYSQKAAFTGQLTILHNCVLLQEITLKMLLFSPVLCNVKLW